jgi:hypothetical protein
MLATRSRVLLEKLIVAHVFKKIPPLGSPKLYYRLGIEVLTVVIMRSGVFVGGTP